ncbi:hypothetical protein ig2599ANME_1252 [groundwater metagenome]
MTDNQLQWTRYNFELFGISFDIFAGSHVAIMLNPLTPNIGYLVQSRGSLVLTVSYGTDSSLESWLKRISNSGAEEVLMIQEKQPIEFCGHPAERVVVKVVPPLPAIGHRHWRYGTENVEGGYAGPFLLTMVGTTHRQTPLVAMFQKPSLHASSYARAEKHFFASFLCQT